MDFPPAAGGGVILLLLSTLLKHLGLILIFARLLKYVLLEFETTESSVVSDLITVDEKLSRKIVHLAKKPTNAYKRTCCGFVCILTDPLTTDQFPKRLQR